MGSGPPAMPEVFPKNPMVGSLPFSCARAAIGQAAAAPTSSVLNSRRFITQSPRRRARAAKARLRGRAPSRS